MKAGVRIIDRYIGRELFISMGLGLSFFTFVLLTKPLLKLIELVVTKHVPLGSVAWLFLYILPPLLVFTAPMALLLAIIATYGRLAADQELTALKAAGCRLYRLSLAAFGVGTAAMAITAASTIYGVPWAAQSFRELVFALTRTQATIGIEERVFNDDFHGLILYANRLDDAKGVMEGVFVVDTRDEKNPRTITARRGRVTPDDRQNTVVLELQDGSAHVIPEGNPGHYQVSRFQTLKLPLSVSDPRTAGLRERNPDELTIAELLAGIQEREASGENTADLQVSLHKRFATPAACLVFVILGIPLAIRIRRSGRGISLGVTVALAFMYYALMVFGHGMGKNGLIPPFWGVWIPNLLLGSVGLLFFLGGDDESWIPASLRGAWATARGLRAS
jgi:lipopolysaccharide export system permease protein